MLEEFSKNLNKNKFSETKDIAKEKMICEDGFCSLPSHKKITKQAKNDMNLFDPI